MRSLYVPLNFSLYFERPQESRWSSTDLSPMIPTLYTRKPHYTCSIVIEQTRTTYKIRNFHLIVFVSTPPRTFRNGLSFLQRNLVPCRPESAKTDVRKRVYVLMARQTTQYDHFRQEFYYFLTISLNSLTAAARGRYLHLVVSHEIALSCHCHIHFISHAHATSHRHWQATVSFFFT